jgi:hypothetical protein
MPPRRADQSPRSLRPCSPHPGQRPSPHRDPRRARHGFARAPRPSSLRRELPGARDAPPGHLLARRLRRAGTSVGSTPTPAEPAGAAAGAGSAAAARPHESTAALATRVPKRTQRSFRSISSINAKPKPTREFGARNTALASSPLGAFRGRTFRGPRDPPGATIGAAGGAAQLGLGNPGDPGYDGSRWLAFVLVLQLLSVTFPSLRPRRHSSRRSGP